MPKPIPPDKLAELQAAAMWKSSERMTPRFSRLPPDLDAAVDEWVAQVPGLDRSALIRTAVAHYIGFKRAPPARRRPPRPIMASGSRATAALLTTA